MFSVLLILFTYILLQDSVNTSKPFQNKAIIRGLASAFFRGPRSFAARHQSEFQYNVNGNDVCLVPPSMIALVATAVCLFIYYIFDVTDLLQVDSVLTDWQTGTHLASNFTCNAAHPIYRKHLAMLKKIKREKGAGYYTMLCELYTRAA